MSQSVTSFILKNLQVKTKSGFEWLCLCPYHEDKSPSFSFNIKKRLFVCYACGAKGNLQQLMEHLNVSADIRGEEKSVDEVSEKIANAKFILNSPNRPAVGVPYPSSYREGIAREKIVDFWMGERYLKDKHIDAYRLGYDYMNDQAIIPIRDDESGLIVSLIRRRANVEDGQSRYLYSKGAKISEMVFGAREAVDLFALRSNTKHSLVITEGAIDAMSVYGLLGYGDRVYAGVAILGSRMSKAQGEIIRSIGADEIIIATDADRAGKVAETQIATMLKDLRCGVIVHKAMWDGTVGKDLNELLIKKSTPYISKLLDEAVRGTPFPKFFTGHKMSAQFEYPTHSR